MIHPVFVFGQFTKVHERFRIFGKSLYTQGNSQPQRTDSFQEDTPELFNTTGSRFVESAQKQLEGKKFRWQHSVGNYILDFYCPEERIAIELDGSAHFSSAGMEADQECDAYLNELKIKVLRFENRDVFENMDGVLEEIRLNFKQPPLPPPEFRMGI